MSAQTRMRHSSTLGWLTVGLALLTGWLAPSAAQACDCEGVYGYVVWPRDGAVDVPRDTPIVIQRQNFFGETDELRPVLVDDEGTEIELEVVRHLPRLGVDCAFSDTLFLRPAAPLEAGVQHTLLIRAESADDDGGVPEGFESRSVSFDVGDGAYAPTSVDLDITYLHVGPAAGCSEEPCELAELKLELAEEPNVPYWFAAESHASDDNAMRTLIAPAAWFAPTESSARSTRISVLVESTDRCVTLTVYGLDGTALFEEERCTPDECVLSNTWGFSDCGEPPSLVFSSEPIADTDCDDPQLYPEADAGPRDDAGLPPEPDAAVPGGADAGPGPSGRMDAGRVADTDASVDDDGDASGGCSCSVGGPGPLDAGVWLVLLVLLRRRATRSSLR